MARAVALLSRREHSRVELERKLRRVCEARAREAGAREAGAVEAEARDAGSLDAVALESVVVDSVADDPDEIGRVLDALEAQGLLSDARFAGVLVRQRSLRYGDRRLADDLRARGVDAAMADQALGMLRGTEAARAQAVWSRRFDALPTNADERGRQGRYLQNRGFSMDAIQRVLAGRIAPSE